MNWIEAENYCQSFGAHLPIPKNMDDINFFRCISYLKKKNKIVVSFLIIKIKFKYRVYRTKNNETILFDGFWKSA